MSFTILVGTVGGLRQLGAEERTHLEGHEITAVAHDRSRRWAITDGRALWRSSRGGGWQEVAAVAGAPATCMAPTAAGLLVGTAGARLLRLDGRRLVPVDAFEAAEGRQAWYTPWGDPPDARSISADPAGAIYVNVHVGGVLRSTDGGRSWHPTLDIDTDVHQVLAHPSRAGLVLVAAAIGLGLSGDGGRTWRFATDGLHARYMRALALAGDTIVASASTGPGGRRSGLYRRALEPDEPFARCRDGLPDWFAANIDTACLAASGERVAFGTEDGTVFLSTDAGRSWTIAAKGLPPVQCLAIGMSPSLGSARPPQGTRRRRARPLGSV